jgi:hypothetical protein
LKGESKIQGNWGEMILERVLEKSGLEKGREYEIQKSFFTEEGNRVQPDVVINLPDGKKMILKFRLLLTKNTLMKMMKNKNLLLKRTCKFSEKTRRTTRK